MHDFSRKVKRQLQLPFPKDSKPTTSVQTQRYIQKEMLAPFPQLMIEQNLPIGKLVKRTPQLFCLFGSSSDFAC